MASRLRVLWPPLLVAVVFVAAWQIIVVAGNIKPYLLPSPQLIFTTFISSFDLMIAAGSYTGLNALLGLIVGIVLGVLLALIAQRLMVIRRMSAPLAAGLAAVPIVSLTPIFNNMFGSASRLPSITVTVLIVFFPIYVNVLRGLVQVRPVQLELMRALSATPGTVLRVLRIPNAIPLLFTGLRIAAPLSVIAALVSEYFGGPQQGLGSRIATAVGGSAYGRAWAYVVMAIIIGLAFYLAVLGIERLAISRSGRPRSN